MSATHMFLKEREHAAQVVILAEHNSNSIIILKKGETCLCSKTELTYRMYQSLYIKYQVLFLLLLSQFTSVVRTLTTSTSET